MTTKEKDTDYRVWVAITQTSKQYVLSALRSKACNNPNQWNLLGGHVNVGESPAEAAVREIFEETGLTVKLKHLKFAFAKVVKGRPCVWLTVPKTKVDFTNLKLTEESTNYEFFDARQNKHQTADEVHYSLNEYLNWTSTNFAVLLNRGVKHT